MRASLLLRNSHPNPFNYPFSWCSLTLILLIPKSSLSGEILLQYLGMSRGETLFGIAHSSSIMQDLRDDISKLCFTPSHPSSLRSPPLILAYDPSDISNINFDDDEVNHISPRMLCLSSMEVKND